MIRLWHKYHEMSEIDYDSPKNSAESTVRLNTPARRQLDRLCRKYGMTRAAMVETALATFEQVLPGDIEVTLPELSHEVVNLEAGVGKLLLHLDHFEMLAQLILAHEYEMGGSVGGSNARPA